MGISGPYGRVSVKLLGIEADLMWGDLAMDIAMGSLKAHVSIQSGLAMACIQIFD
jgi:hypothetical protein